MADQLSDFVDGLRASGLAFDVEQPSDTAPVSIKLGQADGSNLWMFYNNSNELRVSTTLPTSNTSGSALAVEDDSITIDKVDSEILQSASVTLSAAQVNALHSAGIDIVAAQGANTIIQPIHLVGQYTFDTTDFTIGGSDVLAVGYSGGATTMTIAGTGWLDQSSSSNRAINATASAYVPAVNTKIRVYNTGTAFSDGGSSTVKLTLYYRVITIS